MKDLKIVYIYGAGYMGTRIIDVFQYLKEIFSNYDFNYKFIFIDKDSKKHGNINGIECVGIDKAIDNGAQNEPVIVSPVNCEEIINELKNSNFKKIYPMSDKIRKLIKTLPIIKQEYLSNKNFYSNFVPLNHYESPYPDLDEIQQNEDMIFSGDKNIMEISLNEEEQLQTLDDMHNYVIPAWSEQPGNSLRYYSNNGWFGIYDAKSLYYFIRKLKPKKIIEIGSGFSTSVMLDTNELYMNNDVDIISIEPYPQRLKSLLKPTDNLTLHEKQVQEMPVDFFDQLSENDILFIDSSHVAKCNSDVNYFIFEILPRLNKGVYIHFHDIIYPFEYRKEWIYQGRAYTEAYMLRSFLMYNNSFSIQLFNNMISKKFPNNKEICSGGSIWIKKEK